MLDMLVEESLLSERAELNPLEELVRFEPTTTAKKSNQTPRTSQYIWLPKVPCLFSLGVVDMEELL
jgi:hypothetical protein